MTMKSPQHPGEIIQCMIDSIGISVTEAAQHLHVTRQTLSRLINKKSDLSIDMAIRISKAFGSTPEHWLRMQMAYALANMKDKIKDIHVERLTSVHDS